MKKLLIAALVAGSSFNVIADTNAYIGLNAGQASLDGQKDVGVGAYVGANLLSFLGVEIGFQGHGKQEELWLPENDLVNIKDVSQFDSFYFALKPQVMVGPVQLYAKLGRHAWSGETTLEIDGKTEHTYETESGHGYMYGVGADYFFSEGLSAGVLAQKYETKYGNVEHIGVNFTLHFM